MKAREKEKHVMTELPVDRLLTTDEVAAALGGTTSDFVNRLINTGLLLAMHFGVRRKVPSSVLNRFIEEHTGCDIVAEVKAAEEAEAARRRALA